MKKALDYLIAKPARFFFLSALIWGGLMCYLNEKDGVNFHWHDLLVEANGMVFDLLVFGILLSVYESLRVKREKIERLHEEIDDYRGWDEKEAMYRIVGAVKRLNKEGVSKVNLQYCFLQGANLQRVDLHGSSFLNANLIKAIFPGANLNNAGLQHSNLQGAVLEEASLEEANLWNADLQGANLEWANLQKTNLEGANLKGANLIEANMQGANLDKANLLGANLEWAKLQGANFLGANLEGANLHGVNLQGASLEWTNLLAAEVDIHWFEKLDKWDVVGRDIIKAKYLIDEYGKIQLK